MLGSTPLPKVELCEPVDLPMITDCDWLYLELKRQFGLHNSMMALEIDL